MTASQIADAMKHKQRIYVVAALVESTLFKNGTAVPITPRKEEVTTFLTTPATSSILPLTVSVGESLDPER